MASKHPFRECKKNWGSEQQELVLVNLVSSHIIPSVHIINTPCKPWQFAMSEMTSHMT
jgi:hypothetical protein